MEVPSAKSSGEGAGGRERGSKERAIIDPMANRDITNIGEKGARRERGRSSGIRFTGITQASAHKTLGTSSCNLQKEAGAFLERADRFGRQEDYTSIHTFRR